MPKIITGFFPKLVIPVSEPGVYRPATSLKVIDCSGMYRFINEMTTVGFLSNIERYLKEEPGSKNLLCEPIDTMSMEFSRDIGSIGVGLRRAELLREEDKLITKSIDEYVKTLNNLNKVLADRGIRFYTLVPSAEEIERGDKMDYKLHLKGIALRPATLVERLFF